MSAVSSFVVAARWMRLSDHSSCLETENHVEAGHTYRIIFRAISRTHMIAEFAHRQENSPAEEVLTLGPALKWGGVPR